MKLLLISVKSEISKGGIAVWTNMFLSKCPDYDIDCELVNTEVVGKRLQKGVFLLNLKDEFVRTRRIFKDLKNTMCNNEFDAAHLNSSCGKFGLFRDYLVAKRIKKKHIPLTVHFHCDIPYWINNTIRKKCLLKLLKLADSRFVLCENSLRYVEENAKIDAQKIPNFIDDSIIRNDHKEIREQIKNIFFVGRIERPKGAAEIYKLADRFPNLNFKLAGCPSDEVNAWDKPTNVELLGPLPHNRVIEYMDEADIFLFPSHSEGFSLALSEAMARGVPCVATDVGANADMLSEDCGIIVPKGDVGALEQAIQSLSDPGNREKMSKNAINKVKNNYTVDVVLKKLLESYRGV